MTDQERRELLQQILLALLPAYGSMISNRTLLAQWTESATASGLGAHPDDFSAMRDELVARGLVIKGKGRGVSSGRGPAAAAGSDSFALQAYFPAVADISTSSNVAQPRTAALAR